MNDIQDLFQIVQGTRRMGLEEDECRDFQSPGHRSSCDDPSRQVVGGEGRRTLFRTRMEIQSIDATLKVCDA